MSALVDALVPEPQLRAWIGDRVDGDGAFTVERITAGMSNEMFLIARSGHRWILRRPPRVANASTAHSMAREVRVMRALDGTAVPHARCRAFCDDPDVIGAPFYVMDVVDGLRLYDGLPPVFDGAAARHEIGVALVEALAALHMVDWAAQDLEGFGKPAGFTARQVSRWMDQLASYATRPLPDLDAAAEWLVAHTPDMPAATLIHGDYGLHNVMYARTLPVEIVAVVDWETATIGDPLLDLGYLLSLWLTDAEATRWTASALPYSTTGFSDRTELLDRYAHATGFDVSSIDWYRAVSQLKVACILEGAYTRYGRGDGDEPAMAELRERVPNHAAYALAITRGEA